MLYYEPIILTHVKYLVKLCVTLYFILYVILHVLYFKPISFHFTFGKLYQVSINCIKQL